MDEEFTPYNKSLILPEYNIGVVSDIHFCHSCTEARLRSINDQLNQLISVNNIKTLILNGDTFSEFPFPKAGKEIIRNLSTKVNELILLPGNHEENVGGFGNLFEDNPNITIKEYHTISDITIYHGHKEPPVVSEYYIIGHLHPTKNNSTTNKPVHLIGTEKIQGKSSQIIILPSYTRTRNKDYTQVTGPNWMKNLASYTILQND